MRLGDLDELKERISSYAGMFTDEGFMVDLTAVLRGIEFQKTIDAVPVVRCWNCKNGKHCRDGYVLCRHPSGKMLLMRSSDFCSYGEKRADDEQQSVL